MTKRGQNATNNATRKRKRLPDSNTQFLNDAYSAAAAGAVDTKGRNTAASSNDSSSSGKSEPQKKVSKKRRTTKPNVRRACSACRKAHACCNPIAQEDGDISCRRCLKKEIVCDLKPDDVIASSEVLNAVSPKTVESLSNTMDRQSKLIQQLMQQNEMLTRQLLRMQYQNGSGVGSMNLNGTGATHQGAGLDPHNHFNSAFSTSPFAGMTSSPSPFFQQERGNDFIRFFNSNVPVCMFSLPPGVDAKPFSFTYKSSNDAFCKMVGVAAKDLVAQPFTMANMTLSPFNNDSRTQHYVSGFLQNILRQTHHFFRSLEHFNWIYDVRDVQNNTFYRAYHHIDSGMLFTRYEKRDCWSNFIEIGPITMPSTLCTSDMLSEQQVQGAMKRFQHCIQQVSEWLVNNPQQAKMLYGSTDPQDANSPFPYRFGLPFNSNGSNNNNNNNTANNVPTTNQQAMPSGAGGVPNGASGIPMTEIALQHLYGNMSGTASNGSIDVEPQSPLSDTPGFEFEWK